MKILAHRGLHTAPREENGKPALTRALAHNFGVETDVRDHKGALVIAHDMPSGNPLKLEAFLAAYAKSRSTAPLALNIKADGLEKLLLPLLKRHRIRNYFLFDMSGPEAVHYLKAGAKLFTRQSDYEPQPAFYEHAQGVWLDEFDRAWITESVIRRHVGNGKRLCFVSPELHGKPYAARWKFYLRMKRKFPQAQLMLCTDHPQKAAAFFHG